MRTLTMLIALMTLAACASAPEAKPVPVAQHHEVSCTGGAMALIAVTRPWGLKDCVTGEE